MLTLTPWRIRAYSSAGGIQGFRQRLVPDDDVAVEQRHPQPGGVLAGDGAGRIGDDMDRRLLDGLRPSAGLQRHVLLRPLHDAAEVFELPADVFPVLGVEMDLDPVVLPEDDDAFAVPGQLPQRGIETLTDLDHRVDAIPFLSGPGRNRPAAAASV